MKILLFGKNGQVGWELQRSLAPLGELIALDRASTEYCCDLANLGGIAETIREIAPDVIVNAAAYTAVDKAESEPELARTINALAPGVMAKEAEQANAWLVHYSTDYVFDGSGEKPWRETDPVAPLNVYGATKLEGERHIENSGCKHLIFRTSWVYGMRGNNFATTILRLAKERDTLDVVDDQIGSPTGAELLADISAHAIGHAVHNSDVSGLYHLVAGGEISWHGFASFVIEHAIRSGVQIKAKPESIMAVSSEMFKTVAKRPHNSRMNTAKLQHAFDLSMPLWQTGVSRMLTEILDK